MLEARSPGGPWIEFDVVRATATGRFHDSYRFKFPGPVELPLPALSEAEADFPFATGASNSCGCTSAESACKRRCSVFE